MEEKNELLVQKCLKERISQLTQEHFQDNRNYVLPLIQQQEEETKKSKTDVSLVDVMQRISNQDGIKLIAFDFDQTLVKFHTKGSMNEKGINGFQSSNISHDAIELIKMINILKMKQCITSFGESRFGGIAGPKLFRKLLGKSEDRQFLQAITKMPMVGYYPTFDFKPLENYCYANSKNIHLSTMQLFYQKKGVNIKNNEILLVDDDIKNVIQARLAGYQAAWVSPIPDEKYTCIRNEVFDKRHWLKSVQTVTGIDMNIIRLNQLHYNRFDPKLHNSFTKFTLSRMKEYSSNLGEAVSQEFKKLLDQRLSDEMTLYEAALNPNLKHLFMIIVVHGPGMTPQKQQELIQKINEIVQDERINKEEIDINVYSKIINFATLQYQKQLESKKSKERKMKEEKTSKILPQLRIKEESQERNPTSGISIEDTLDVIPLNNQFEKMENLYQDFKNFIKGIPEDDSKEEKFFGEYKGTVRQLAIYKEIIKQTEDWSDIEELGKNFYEAFAEFSKLQSEIKNTKNQLKKSEYEKNSKMKFQSCINSISELILILNRFWENGIAFKMFLYELLESNLGVNTPLFKSLVEVVGIPYDHITKENFCLLEFDKAFALYVQSIFKKIERYKNFDSVADLYKKMKESQKLSYQNVYDNLHQEKGIIGSIFKWNPMKYQKLKYDADPKFTKYSDLDFDVYKKAKEVFLSVAAHGSHNLNHLRFNGHDYGYTFDKATMINMDSIIARYKVIIYEFEYTMIDSYIDGFCRIDSEVNGEFNSVWRMSCDIHKQNKKIKHCIISNTCDNEQYVYESNKNVDLKTVFAGPDAIRHLLQFDKTDNFKWFKKSPIAAFHNLVDKEKLYDPYQVHIETIYQVLKEKDPTLSKHDILIISIPLRDIQRRSENVIDYYIKQGYSMLTQILEKDTYKGEKYSRQYLYTPGYDQKKTSGVNFHPIVSNKPVENDELIFQWIDGLFYPNKAAAFNYGDFHELFDDKNRENLLGFNRMLKYKLDFNYEFQSSVDGFYENIVKAFKYDERTWYNVNLQFWEFLYNNHIREYKEVDLQVINRKYEQRKLMDKKIQEHMEREKRERWRREFEEQKRIENSEVETENLKKGAWGRINNIEKLMFLKHVYEEFQGEGMIEDVSIDSYMKGLEELWRLPKLNGELQMAIMRVCHERYQITVFIPLGITFKEVLDQIGMDIETKVYMDTSSDPSDEEYHMNTGVRMKGKDEQPHNTNKNNSSGGRDEITTFTEEDRKKYPEIPDVVDDATGITVSYVADNATGTTVRYYYDGCPFNWSNDRITFHKFTPNNNIDVMGNVENYLKRFNDFYNEYSPECKLKSFVFDEEYWRIYWLVTIKFSNRHLTFNNLIRQSKDGNCHISNDLDSWLPYPPTPGPLNNNTTMTDESDSGSDSENDDDYDDQ